MPSGDTHLEQGSTLHRVATTGGRALGAVVAVAGLALTATSLPVGTLVWAAVAVTVVLGGVSVARPLAGWELLSHALWLLG